MHIFNWVFSSEKLLSLNVNYSEGSAMTSTLPKTGVLIS